MQPVTDRTQTRMLAYLLTYHGPTGWGQEMSGGGASGGGCLKPAVRACRTHDTDLPRQHRICDDVKAVHTITSERLDPAWHGSAAHTVGRL